MRDLNLVQRIAIAGALALGGCQIETDQSTTPGPCHNGTRQVAKTKTVRTTLLGLVETDQSVYTYTLRVKCRDTFHDPCWDAQYCTVLALMDQKYNNLVER